MYQAHLTLVSRNKKTGPMPVSTVSEATCPTACPLKKNGCYADTGPLQMHWQHVTAGTKGVSWDDFCQQVANLYPTQLWRHAQAGDLPGDGERIDGVALGKLVYANYGRKGFTYTHYRMDIETNRLWVKMANAHGFTINLSANSPAHADELRKAGCGPVVTLLPEGQMENTTTPAGATVVVCPAYTRKGMTCLLCGLCQKSNRQTVVGFPVHGTSKKRAQKVIEIHAA